MSIQTVLLLSFTLSLSMSNAAGAQALLEPPFTVFGRSTFSPPRHPDVAYDESSDRYLVVWSTPTEVFARLVQDDGTTFGAGAIRVAQTNAGYVRPRVANISLRDAFVVTWIEGLSILRARAVFADGTMSNTVTVASGLTHIAPDLVDIAGDAVDRDDDAIVVYPTVNGVIANELTVASGQLFDIGPRTIERTTQPIFNVRVARTGGPGRRLLIAWQAFSTVAGVITDMNRQVLSPVFALHTGGLGEIDGDGSTWVEVVGVTGRSITYDPLTQTVRVGSPQVALSGVSRVQAAACWLNGSALVANFQQNLLTSRTDLYAHSVDPFTSRLCQPQFALEQSQSQTVYGASIATNARIPGDRALFVWDESDTTSSTIRARTLTASDGLVEDLGGGCGRGGEAFASCARADHAFFTLRDRHEIDIITRGVLLISPARIDARCGSCVLVPDPAVAVSVVRGTGITSFKEVPVPMPAFASLRGVSFYTQWALLRIGNSCAPLGADFSNALKVTIQ